MQPASIMDLCIDKINGIALGVSVGCVLRDTEKQLVTQARSPHLCR